MGIMHVFALLRITGTANQVILAYLGYGKMLAEVLFHISDNFIKKFFFLGSAAETGNRGKYGVCAVIAY